MTELDDMSILAIVETNPLLTQEQIDYLLSLVVSTRYGFPKMVKKGDMTPEMLRDRQPIKIQRRVREMR